MPGTRTLLTRALVAAVVTGLGALPVAGTSAAAPPSAAPTASGASASTPLPAGVAGGPAAAPAARSVPAYVTADAVQARTRGGSGGPDVAFAAARPAGAVALWGDFRGTGAETLAFFRAGTWRFQLSDVSGKPVLGPRIRFGVAGDVPVAGDWDADGRTDIGVKRGRTWYLLRGLDVTRAASPSSWRSFRFGSARAVPVAGDWDGRGRDGVGVVRGSRWRLREAGSGVVRSRWMPRPAGAVAAPWSTPAGADPRVCPTMRADYRPVAWAATAPADLSRATSSLADASLAPPSTLASVRTALVRSERYLLGAHYRATWGRQANRRYADVRGSNPREEYAVRLPTMAALTVAVATATGAHDAAATGRSRAEAVGYVDFLVRSAACQHRSVSPGGWGRSWQSAHWASMLGLAAWLLWDELGAPTRAYVLSTVADEATYLLGRGAAYWRDRGGDELPGRSGNTAAEEVAWSVPLLELASRLAPQRESARYRAEAVQLAVAAYATPSDLVSDDVVNGVRVGDRVDGFNALDDGTVVNHQRVHPDYMGNIQHLWWALDIAALDDVAAPAAYRRNAERVYGAFSTVTFTAGTPSAAGGGRRYLAPGGTIYRPGATWPDDVYFPDGSDWGATRRAPFMSIDAHALAYGLAPAGAWSPAAALAAHTRGQLALGDASGAGDGRTYAVDPVTAASQDRYVGREEYAAQQVATAWLALVAGTASAPKVDTSAYAVPPVTGSRVPAGRTASP